MVLESGGKRSHYYIIYSQDNIYSRLENQRGYWGVEEVNGGAVLGGAVKGRAVMR